LALRDGDPYLAWGSPGGGLAFGALPDFVLAAHSAPRMLALETRLPKATVDEPNRRGHIVEVGPAWSEGRLAATKPRGMQGYAAGR